MKILTKISIAITTLLLLTSSFICFADDGKTFNVESTDLETISLKNGDAIFYQTTVIDLDTGEQYHAKTDKPAVIEAKVGHRYYVLANAQTTTTDKSIAANAHFKVGANSLVINYNFSGGGDTFNHVYSFTMPKNAKLSPINKSFFSNCEQNSQNDLKSATSSQGITTDLSYNRAVNDGFIMEVKITFFGWVKAIAAGVVVILILLMIINN